jgi:signal transduction histidine kinase
VGIPEDELPKLFDPFFRASTSDSFTGTGLGLSIVREVVEGHGGTIGVESAVGSGSTFRVVLPAGG